MQSDRDLGMVEQFAPISTCDVGEAGKALQGATVAENLDDVRARYDTVRFDDIVITSSL